MTGMRRLGVPRPVHVHATARGTPEALGETPVEVVAEEWVIEDRWWTERPLRRRYWEIVTTCGRNEVVFCDLLGGRWWRQR